MEPVLRDLDCVLACSRSEGLPVALIEAAAAGLPAVATRVGGVPEIVVEERTGFLGDDAGELAYGLARVFERPETAPAMGQRARLRAQARHSAQRLADNLEQLYQVVHEERRRCAS
jgi:glycosyltransferase involved in cell wall biosynthesis